MGLSKARRISTGGLGKVIYPRGLYVYIGSAQKGLAQRLARHLRQKKASRWHIDYLLKVASLRYILAWDLPKAKECYLAQKVSKLKGASTVVPGFGSSDCRCQPHLFRFGST